MFGDRRTRVEGDVGGHRRRSVREEGKFLAMVGKDFRHLDAIDEKCPDRISEKEISFLTKSGNQKRSFKKSRNGSLPFAMILDHLHNSRSALKTRSLVSKFLYPNTCLSLPPQSRRELTSRTLKLLRPVPVTTQFAHSLATKAVPTKIRTKHAVEEFASIHLGCKYLRRWPINPVFLLLPCTCKS